MMKLFGGGKDKDEKEKEGQEVGVDADAQKTKRLLDKWAEYKGQLKVCRIEKLKDMSDRVGVQVWKGVVNEFSDVEDALDKCGVKYGGILMANVKARDTGAYIVTEYIREYYEPSQDLAGQSGGGESTTQGFMQMQMQQQREEREREERRREELRLEREERMKENQELIKAMTANSQAMFQAMQSNQMEMNKMIIGVVTANASKAPNVMELATQIKALMGDGKEAMGNFVAMFTLAKDVLEGRQPTGDKSPMEFLGDVLKKVVEGLSTQAKDGKRAGGTEAEPEPKQIDKGADVKPTNALETFVLKHKGELYQAIQTDIMSDFEKGKGLVQVFLQDAEFGNVPLVQLRTMLQALTPERVVEFIPLSKGKESHLKAILAESLKAVESEIQAEADEVKDRVEPAPEQNTDGDD